MKKKIKRAKSASPTASPAKSATKIATKIKTGTEIRTGTKIAIIEDAEATGEVAAAYDFWRTGSGRTQVPGIIKCFGARPDFLRQVLEFSNTIHFSEGHLSRRCKEMIASHVSYLNRCPY